MLKDIYKPSYHNYNKAIGVLESVKLEFYRREVASYENKKIKENDDIYSLPITFL
jgi:predicted DNA-binding protein with PD1-like motif